MNGLTFITRGLNYGGDYALANKGLGIGGIFVRVIRIWYEIVRLKSILWRKNR